MKHFAIFAAEKEEPGITASSAQSVCNILRVRAERVQSIIESFSFVRKTIESMSGESIVLQDYVRPGEGTLENMFNELGGIHAFIAYLNEAIKAKKQEIVDIESGYELDYSSLCKHYGEEVIFPGSNYMVIPDELSFEQALKVVLTKSEYTTYLDAISKAAAIGKAIHKGGVMARHAEAVLQAKKNPATKEGTDKNLVIIRVGGLQTDVSNHLESLQREHRKYVALQNAFENKVKEFLRDEEIEANQIRKENQNLTKQAIERRAAHYSQLTIRMKEEIEGKKDNINKLKIRIPKAFDSIYQSTK